MRKGTLFLSAALTAFILSILVGVVSTYQNNVKRVEAAAQAAPSPEVQAVSEPIVAAPAPVFTPEQATALASQVLGRTDLYSVETADLNGQSTYMVTFSSGDVVYVSMDGQIVSITHITPTVVTVPATHRQRREDNSTNPPPPGDHHDDDHENDHEDH